jgi:hypothetical protein
VIGRWISVRSTQVIAPKSVHVYTPNAPRYGIKVKPGTTTHTYTARPAIAATSSLVLAWDANPAGDNVTGYTVYWGAAPAVYTSNVAVGNVTTYSMSIAGKPSPLYAAITASNAQGQSAFSNEVHT